MTYDEYMQMLMMQQMVPWTSSDPYAPSVYPTDASGGGFIAPPMDKYGNIQDMNLANQAKAFNATQDWADINSDPAILGGVYGETPNYGTTTYEPIPQLTLLQNAAAMGESTIEGMIANEILSGGSAASALSKIRQLATPGSPTYDEAFAAMVPTFQREGQTGEVVQEIDNDFLKDIANQFQQAYLSVPRDPATGQVAYTIDPATGAPSIATTKPSELGQWYQDTNTPLPTEQYDPMMLADEAQLRRRDETPVAFADAMRRMIETAAERERLTSTPLERNPYVTAPEGGVPQGVAAPRATPAAGGIPERGGIADDLQRFTQTPGEHLGNALTGLPGAITQIPGALDRTVGNRVESFFGGGDEGAGKAMGRSIWKGQPQPSGPGAGVSAPGARRGAPLAGEGLIQQMLQQAQREKLRKNTVASLDARGDKTRAVQDLLQVQADAEQRQAMMRQLAQQGHTPYNDTMARRRAMAQYGGFGI